MGIQHASRVVRLFGDPSFSKIGQHRHDEVIDAVMNEGHDHATRVKAICGQDLDLTEVVEMHMSAAVAALLLAHADVAYEILPFIHSELSRQSHHSFGTYVPAAVIGCLDAMTWLDKHTQSAGMKLNTDMPLFAGIMLRKYGKWTPQQDTLGTPASQWAVGRFADVLSNYTQTSSPDENVRRISIILGKMSEYSGSFPKCTHAFIAQVSYRAMKFIPPGAQIKALDAVLNADRVIPKDSGVVVTVVE